MIHSCLVWFLWWLRHGAIGPIEATPVVVNVDWLEFRIYTFEYGNSFKWNSWPYRFAPFLRCPAVPAVPWDPCELHTSKCEAAPNSQKPFFVPAASAFDRIHDMNKWRQQACPLPAGVVSLVSGEVKHIVHLIRWNLKAVLCQLGQDLNTGLEWHNARLLGFRNWILF